MFIKIATPPGTCLQTSLVPSHSCELKSGSGLETMQHGSCFCLQVVKISKMEMLVSCPISQLLFLIFCTQVSCLHLSLRIQSCDVVQPQLCSLASVSKHTSFLSTVVYTLYSTTLSILTPAKQAHCFDVMKGTAHTAHAETTFSEESLGMRTTN